MEAIGLPDGSYVVKVNNRKLLKGFLQSLGIEAEDQEQAILRVVDKLDKIGIRDLERELAAGRTDGQSGGAIEGLHLAQPLIDQIVGFLLSFFEADVPKARDQVLKRLATHAGGPGGNATFETGLRELETIHSLLHRLGIGEDRVQFDPTLVRGMAYYTGPVFEVVSRLEVTDAAGRGRRFGSICGGGRYDGLVEKLLGIAVPATGASIGVDRLAELLRLTGSNVTVPGPVLVAVLDRNLMADYQLLAQELRAAGLPAEVYIGSRMKLRDQLSYADARNCPVALLVGEDEMKDGVVTLRNLRLGKQLADQIQDKDAWRQKVQQKVPRTDIVPRVRELLI
jgi:histidyl-tRNA synthetase